VKIDNLNPVASRVVEVAAERRSELQFVSFWSASHATVLPSCAEHGMMAIAHGPLIEAAPFSSVTGLCVLALEWELGSGSVRKAEALE
jgi:hypothetical protein